jgi:hypothetical protein
MRDGRTPPFNPFADGVPPRDEELAALLRHAVGDVPSTVDWEALATRIAHALPSRSNVAWWSYAERWSRRIVPIALAASLVGAAMLWNADSAEALVVAQAPTDVIADVVQGVPIEDAASTFARTIAVDETLAMPGAE